VGGALVLALLVPRLLARWLSGVPLLSNLPLWQRIIARATEAGLYYLLMIAQPLAGWLMTSLKGSPISLFGMALPALAAPDRAMAKQVEGLHEFGGTLILVFVGLHVLGALYHHGMGFWSQ
jgi:cytochrome b561